ncbi:MBL fold metallo-hydrolase [Syntrophaceticus schinkii]|uniref:Putative Beta-lactamase domain protein n=1 Tax=Syntrophaceticus schinkii TaxID=499207 RepID=A0A0B7MAD2_9FIRM|nr:MBL fold metallo-hydrolase [Syntrophaceticus schinkii]CEO87454.1 putative Beta-lactamase domain protein [Syntrophaceticus schinkii]
MQIAGNTYCFNYPSLIGLYFFDSGSCLLIDTGAKKEQTLAILKYLHKRKITVHSIFNTHHHADHCTGNQIIQNRSNCRIYASALEATLIENPILTPFILYSAYPPPVLRNKFLLASPSRVTNILKAGDQQINGVPFQVLDLKGHTLGQLGIVTPDGVTFLGDSLLADDILNRIPFPYLADANGHFTTLDFLQNTNFSYAVLTHGGQVIDVQRLAERNREVCRAVIRLILEITKEPTSREEIVSILIRELSLPLSTTQYYFIHTTTSAFLSYLNSINRIRLRLVGGNIKFISV